MDPVSFLLILKPIGAALGGVLLTMLVQAVASPVAIRKMIILLARRYVKKTKSPDDDEILAVLEEAWGQPKKPEEPPAA